MTSTITDRLYGESSGVAVKAPCLTVSNGPLPLVGLGAVGGYTPLAGDRILVKDQADLTTNGIYNASNGAWKRSGDFDGSFDCTQGTLIVVYFPNAGATVYQLTTFNPIIGTTPLTFASFLTPNQIYPQTAAEAAAGVAPTFYFYPPGDVRRYGADVTGANDSMAAIQNAANCNAHVILPPGTFKTSNTITFVNPCLFEGSGYGTIIAPNFANADVFDDTSSGFSITEMQISASVLRTGGYYINVRGAGDTYVRMENLWFSGACFGIAISGPGGSFGYRLSNINASFVPNAGIGININTTSTDVEFFLSNIFLVGSNPTQMVAGIQIGNCGDLTIEHASTLGTGTGLLVNPQAGQLAQEIFLTDCFFDSGSGPGVALNPGAGGLIFWFKMSNSWACTNQNGIVCGNAGLVGTVDLVQLENVTASNNGPGGYGSTGGGGAGVLVYANVGKHTIIGGDFANNATGIIESTGVTGFRIIGAICSQSGEFGVSPNTHYGIQLVNGNDDFIISGCDLTGNTLGALSFGSLPGVVGQTYTIRDNLGLNTDASGQLALNAASTITVVNHGLAAQPSAQQISLRQNSSLGTAAQAWVSATSPTTFTITTNANPGAGVTMGWAAQVLH